MKFARILVKVGKVILGEFSNHEGVKKAKKGISEAGIDIDAALGSRRLEGKPSQRPPRKRGGKKNGGPEVKK
jgi:hypothetical protein